MDNIVHHNTNQYEYEGYATDLNDGNFESEGYATDLNDNNFENNLNAPLASAGIERNHINSGSIYSDISNQQQNPTLRLLSVVINI